MATRLPRAKSEKAVTRIPVPRGLSVNGWATRPRPRPRTTQLPQADLIKKNSSTTSAILAKLTNTSGGVSTDKVKEDLQIVVKDLEKHGYKKHMLETPDTQRQISTLVDRITSGKLNLGRPGSSEKDVQLVQQQKKVSKKSMLPVQIPSGSVKPKASPPALPPIANATAGVATPATGESTPPKPKPSKRTATKVISSRISKAKSLPFALSKAGESFSGRAAHRGKKKSKSKKRKEEQDNADENLATPSQSNTNPGSSTAEVDGAGIPATGIIVQPAEVLADAEKVGASKSKVSRTRKSKHQKLTVDKKTGMEDLASGTQSTSEIPATATEVKPVREKKKAKAERAESQSRAIKSALEPLKLKKIKPGSKKVRELRAHSQSEYLRFLMGDTSVTLSKKRGSKARPHPSQLGLSPSILGMLSAPPDPQVPTPIPPPPAQEKPPAASVKRSRHQRQTPSRSAGRIGLGFLDESDREMLDKADSIVVANAENFVDFASMESKRQGSATMLQRVAQYCPFESSKMNTAADDDELRDGELFKAEVKLPGILNQNISLEFAGEVLIVIAYRAKDKKHNARKITEIVEIPSHVDVASLRIGRRPNGTLWIEEWTAEPDDHDQLKRDLNFYLTDAYPNDRESMAAAIVRGGHEPGLAPAPANTNFSLSNL